MNRVDLRAELGSNNYPGRGIIIGRTQDAAVFAYFIMGRSENSRNRVFELFEGGMRTRAFDESKLSDPSLIIYCPVRELSDITIVTNGDQTDTVYESLSQGGCFEEALRRRTFEPDAPNFTPRISGVLYTRGESVSYKLSILKCAGGNCDSVQRFFYEYPQPIAGEGHFIHTYKCDGNPIPSFEGEPKCVEIPDSIDDFTELLWGSLNEENKVSLMVRYIPLDGSAVQTRLINKNK